MVPFLARSCVLTAASSHWSVDRRRRRRTAYLWGSWADAILAPEVLLGSQAPTSTPAGLPGTASSASAAEARCCFFTLRTLQPCSLEGASASGRVTPLGKRWRGRRGVRTLPAESPPAMDLEYYGGDQSGGAGSCGTGLGGGAVTRRGRPRTLAGEGGEALATFPPVLGPTWLSPSARSSLTRCGPRS